jgi:hypothetical protein
MENERAIRIYDRNDDDVTAPFNAFMDSFPVFRKEEADFARSVGIDPANWQVDYLAKPDDERRRISTAHLGFMRDFNRRGQLMNESCFSVLQFSQS